jgi:formamidopyrimidine-DNA glycosylase
MPELPEVEVTRRGLLSQLRGHAVTAAVVRNGALRYPVSPDLAKHIVGRTLADVARRAKYLLLDFGTGTLLVHLGMSGSLRLLKAEAPADKHDHVDIVFGRVTMRFRDPRRFGALLWLDGEVEHHRLLAGLGVEPLSAEFSAHYLYQAARRRSVAIKPLLMDSRVVVGIGNIYASESLFRAGIRPALAARRLTRANCTRLVAAVRETLEDALAAGGSTLRDYVSSDGSPGCFQQQYHVYGCAGAPCRRCGMPIRQLRQGQRSSFYCPQCQR